MSTEAAGRVNVVLSVNQVNFTAAMKEAQANLDKFASKSKAAGHATVNSTQAASAALRVMQGNMTNNIRAVERFVGAIPGVGAALKIAFPLVGGIAFASLIVDMGMKVANFIKTVDGMPKAIQKGFESLALSQKTANDELDVTNDKLQNSIDKLEKKPTDGLKLGMDEARLSADHLAGAITGASDKLDELLSKNHISGMQALWGMWGTVSTAGVQGTAKYFNNKISTDAGNYADDPSAKNHSAMMGDVTAALKEATASLKRETDKRDAPASTAERVAGAAAGLSSPLSLRPDNSSVINDLTGEVNYYKGLLRTDSATTKNQALDKQHGADQDMKDAADLAKQQTEAAKAAANARVQAMTANLESMKLQNNLSIKQVYDYWAEMKSEFASGSAAYNSIVAKQTQATVEGAKAAHEEIAKSIAASKQDRIDNAINGPEMLNRSASFMRGQAAISGRQQTQGYLDSNQDTIDQAQNSAREQEVKITDEAGKSLTRYAAAQQLANVHTQEFITIQEALQGILDSRIAEDKANPTPQSARAVTAARAGLANAQSQRGIQISQDQQNINPVYGTAAIGAKDALNDFVNASRDAAGMMRDIVTNTLAGLNNSIVNGLTGGKTNFGQVAKNAGKSVLSAGLNKAEGSVLSAFGLGGKMGTKGNPMYVTMAPSATSGASSAISSLLPKTGVGGFFGGLLSSFLPHFANGGQINGPALVGENGPEIWTPPANGGTVIPNNKLSLSSGGGQNITYSIDARGTDPVQTEMRVRAAIVASHQSAVTQSVKQVHQQAARQPARR